MSRKVTLAHNPDGLVTHATLTGFDPTSDTDLDTMHRLKEAITEGVKVMAFDSTIQVEHIFEPRDEEA